MFVDLPRPCFLPEIRKDPKGKARNILRYETIMMPYDKLKLPPRTTEQLNPGLRFAIFEAIAHQLSDIHAANRRQKAHLKLFTTIHERTQNTS